MRGRPYDFTNKVSDLRSLKDFFRGFVKIPIYFSENAQTESLSQAASAIRSVKRCSLAVTFVIQ